MEVKLGGKLNAAGMKLSFDTLDSAGSLGEKQLSGCDMVGVGEPPPPHHWSVAVQLCLVGDKVWETHYQTLGRSDVNFVCK